MRVNEWKITDDEVGLLYLILNEASWQDGQIGIWADMLACDLEDKFPDLVEEFNPENDL